LEIATFKGEVLLRKSGRTETGNFGLDISGGQIPLTRLLLANVWMIVFVFFSVVFAFPGEAGAQTRSLKLYYLHTGERDTIT